MAGGKGGKALCVLWYLHGSVEAAIPLETWVHDLEEATDGGVAHLGKNQKELTSWNMILSVKQFCIVKQTQWRYFRMVYGIYANKVMIVLIDWIRFCILGAELIIDLEEC